MAGRTVTRSNRSLRLVIRPNRDESVDSGQVLFGCAYRGRIRRLATSAEYAGNPSERFFLRRVAGTHVAITTTGGNKYTGKSTTALRVRDVASGRSYRAYLQVAGFGPGLNKDVKLAKYLLNRRGQLAAAFHRYPVSGDGTVGSTPIETTIVRFSSRGARRVLDSGSATEVPASSLGLVGSQVFWSHSGVTRSDP